MTRNQKVIYAYILKFHRKHGYVPSSRSLSKKFAMTPQGMNRHYNALVKLNKLRKVEKVERYWLGDNQTVQAE